MEKDISLSGRIFKYLAYIFLAAGCFVLVRYFTKAEPTDPIASKDLDIFVEQAIFESDQKLKQDSVDNISNWVSWYKSNASLYNEAKRHDDQKIQAQSRVLKEKLTKVQKKSFPAQRKSYARSKVEVLASKKIEIETSGQTNDTLLFKGEIFESKQAQHQFMKGIDQIAQDLRFHKVVFKWNESDRNHTDYEIPSKMDAEI